MNHEEPTKKKNPNSVSKIHNKPDNRILLAHKASQLQEQPQACKFMVKNSNKLNQQSQKAYETANKKETQFYPNS
jgi:hypothetical protein